MEARGSSTPKMCKSARGARWVPACRRVLAGPDLPSSSVSARLCRGGQRALASPCRDEQPRSLPEGATLHPCQDGICSPPAVCS